MRKHPIQNVSVDAKGVKRFVDNKIVRFLLNEYKPGFGALKEKFAREAPEDYEQFVMLVGCSLDKFIDIASQTSSCRLDTVREAQMKKLYAK